MSGTQEQEPLTIFVEAKDVSVGDWVVPQGIVKTANKAQNGMIAFIFENDGELYLPDDKIEVRVEDHGETE